MPRQDKEVLKDGGTMSTAGKGKKQSQRNAPCGNIAEIPIKNRKPLKIIAFMCRRTKNKL